MAQLSMEAQSHPISIDAAKDSSINKEQTIITNGRPSLGAVDSFVKAIQRLRLGRNRPRARSAIALDDSADASIPLDRVAPIPAPEVSCEDQATSYQDHHSPREIKPNGSGTQQQDSERVITSQPRDETNVSNLASVQNKSITEVSSEESSNGPEVEVSAEITENTTHTIDISKTHIPGSLSEPIHHVLRATGREGVADFVQVGEDFFEATRLRPVESLKSRWTESWKKTLNDRLKRLNLPRNAISTLKLCVGSSTPDAAFARPTIILICAPEFCSVSKRKEIERELARLVDFFPAALTLKVIPGTSKLCSLLRGSPLYPGNRTGLIAEVLGPANSSSIMGMLSRVVMPDVSGAHYTLSTIGGLISVGDSFCFLTVAHSVCGAGALIRDYLPRRDTREFNYYGFGNIESYEWSGSESSEIPNSSEQSSMEPSISQDDASGVDWMLIGIGSAKKFEALQCRNQFTLPSIFASLRSPRDVAGYVVNEKLCDGEVWVCAGITGVQVGILDITPVSIIYGRATFDVRSVALEHPLGNPCCSLDIV
jgi:hypothetical protein